MFGEELHSIRLDKKFPVLKGHGKEDVTKFVCKKDLILSGIR